MAYQVLARKWRPKQFEEVVGQTHVTRALQNSIKLKKLAHAYLFTGTRGVGKTSIARLFSKAIRCENPKADFNPCLVCQNCKDVDAGNSLDYIEIDGASNNSVDDVRALIENVNYLPAKGQYKIYVVDEVHMLSVSAFNALLKTLEEPPAHVIFILATTDPHKLLGTVISRCQRYDFKNVPTEILVNHINFIAKEEQITFQSPWLVQKLAELGAGSVRDTLSLFDQILGLSENNKVTDDSFTLALGLARISAVRDLVSALLMGDVKQVSHLYKQTLEENVDIKKLTDQILEHLFQTIQHIDSRKFLFEQNIVTEASLKDITLSELLWVYESLVKDLSWAQSSMNPEKVILVCLQKLTLRRTILKGDDLKLSDIPQTEASASQKKNELIVETSPAVETAPIKIKIPEVIAEVNTEVAVTPELVTEKKAKPAPVIPAGPKSWDGFLNYLRETSPATATNLEHGNILDENSLELRPIEIKIAFPEAAAVFRDYLEDREVYARLKQVAVQYFSCLEEELSIRFLIINNEEKEAKNFRTKVELDDEHRASVVENRRSKIFNDPFIKEAEKIFNAKIDKIILKD